MTAGIVLVQGASRGLSLQFCKFLVTSRHGTKVIGTCREPDLAAELQALRERNPETVTILQLDVTSQRDIQEAAHKVGQEFGHLDLLINSSGMLHPSGNGETCLREVSSEGLSLALATNTIGPLLMAKYFSPLLMTGRGMFGAQSSDQSKQHNAILVTVT